MNISVNGASYIQLFGFLNISQTTISSFIVTVILCVAGVLLGRNLKKRPGKAQVLVEKGVMMIHNMVLDTMGPHNASWTPFIATIFLSSICGSYIGLTGFLTHSYLQLKKLLKQMLLSQCQKKKQRIILKLQILFQVFQACH